MIFSDQDLDGDHIAGLLINFVQSSWPSVLQIRPDFFQRFATPILKVFKKAAKAGAQEHAAFLSEGEFARWQQEHPDWRGSFRAKYYKGLGTSTREEAIGYFSDPEKHSISFRREGEEDDRSVELAFGADESDARKQWIADGLHAGELDYNKDSASLSQFINLSLVKFSAYSCERAIPSLMDGLKPSQRKVVHVARKMSVEEDVVHIRSGRSSSRRHTTTARRPSRRPSCTSRRTSSSRTTSTSWSQSACSAPAWLGATRTRARATSTRAPRHWPRSCSGGRTIRGRESCI
ncbi:unnamed protein product [Prorocentrum cordatum]|uniref:DNA topoisomerase (ATP-hydrolyzing) n=1 Tax=Prorocentrum cordatum TaxID=2364126 RepID=A0ABN9RCE5_9DINO|nr:unnamed protein product [Polarella glacialis]